MKILVKDDCAVDLELGGTTVKAVTQAYVAVASLAFLVTATLRIGPLLPEPFHLLDGGWLIPFALLVYGAGILTILLSLSGAFHLLEMADSERTTLRISGVVIVVYCAIVSLALWDLSRSTDL